jgi:ATP-binding cassette subfamily C protein CydC
VAVVGPSGAGKSTLVNLLARFWDYEEGSIRLGGRELRDIPPEAVRDMLSIVTQNTFLFNATIRDNLRLARPDATQEQIEAAARQAHVHDFIMSLPQGYDTWIGEQGLRLSGGERQRLAIGRALLRDAPILILDEATANLDALTERAVLETLAELMASRTTLMITHRLVGLENADEIVVLQGGQVVQRGHHVELLAADGVYRRLWEAAALERG